MNEGCCDESPRDYQPKSKAREIYITQANNGIIVRVGCETFVFTNYEMFFNLLKEYFSRPNELEKDFNSGKLDLS